MKSSGSEYSTNSIAAFSLQSSGSIRTVELKRIRDGFKVLSARTIEIDGRDEFILKPTVAKTASRRDDKVMGIDCSGIAFYCLQIPPVNDGRAASIVEMQMETILPLPPDQMQVDWQGGDIKNGKRIVTVAVAKKQQLRKYVELASDYDVSKIILNRQGLVKAFNRLYECPDSGFVIANVRCSDTQLLLSENGRLVHAITLDIGSDEISGGKDFASSDCLLFVHDLTSAMELFAEKTSDTLPILVLTPDMSLTNDVMFVCVQAGIDTREAVYIGTCLKGDDVFSAGKPGEYLEAVGIAMLAIENDASELNLFRGIYERQTEQKKKGPWRGLIFSSVVCVAMLLLTLFVCTKTNAGYLARYDNDDVRQLIKMQKARKYIAGQRPDILDLLMEISKGAPKGMMTDSFSFKKGQPVIISGKASNLDEVIKLQEFLGSKKDLDNIDIGNPKRDEKAKKTSYRITFDYKDWTKKRSKR